MNWDRVEGQWKQKRGRAVQHWGKLMNDELAAIAGKHEQLVGILQEKYGIAKEDASRHVHDFKSMVKKLKQSNDNLLKLKKRSRVAKTKLKKTAKVRVSARRRKV